MPYAKAWGSPWRISHGRRRAVVARAGAARAQAEQEAQEADLPGGSPRWAPGRIRALVGVSGVYNVDGLADHFHERGLYRPLLERIMSLDGRPELKLFSPAHCVKARRPGRIRPGGWQQVLRAFAPLRVCAKAGKLLGGRGTQRRGDAGSGAQGVQWGGQLPRVLLLHGTADRCALVGNAQQFAETLRDAGAQARRTLCLPGRLCRCCARADGRVLGLHAVLRLRGTPNPSMQRALTLCPVQQHARSVCAGRRCLTEEAAQVEVVLYEGETHTSPLIENPMRGGRDRLTDDVLATVLERPGMESWQTPMCPGLLIRAAAAVCPF